MIVYLNGQFIPKENARISPDDRGFLLADGVYEVMRRYPSGWFEAQAHMARLAHSLGALHIDGPDAATVLAIADELCRRNGLDDAVFYLQVTRGAAQRLHAFPPNGTPPTVYAFVRPPQPATEQWERGVSVIRLPDIRWARCDIKSIALTPNVLAAERARATGVEEAIFVRDGVAMEGTHTNLCAVFGERLVTHPKTNNILPGITRGVVLTLCQTLNVPCDEAPIYDDALLDADEILILGTTTEITPVVRVDGHVIGDGKPGEVTRRLQAAFHERSHLATA